MAGSDRSGDDIIIVRRTSARVVSSLLLLQLVSDSRELHTGGQRF